MFFSGFIENLGMENSSVGVYLEFLLGYVLASAWNGYPRQCVTSATIWRDCVSDTFCMLYL